MDGLTGFFLWIGALALVLLFFSTAATLRDGRRVARRIAWFYVGIWALSALVLAHIMR